MKNSSSLCNSADSLLLIVDIQPTLTDAMPEDESEQMLKNTSALLHAASILEIPILLTEQYPKGLGPTDNTLLEQLPTSAKRFEKTGFSCCAAEKFLDTVEITARTQIVTVGQEAHVCVLQTALDLQNKGLSVFVAEDSICSRKQEHKFFALERMRQNHITITNYESVIFEWLRDASHPHFKEISNLIR